MNIENETIVENESLMRIYEISYILVPTMSEESAINKAEQLKKSIADLGGSFISEETPYMRDLAYEMVRVIKNVNNRFDTGYFGWVKFEIDATLIATLDKNLKLDEEVIRYMAVKTEREFDIITKKALQAKARESDEANIDTANSEGKDSLETEVLETSVAEAPSESVVTPVEEVK